MPNMNDEVFAAAFLVRKSGRRAVRSSDTMNAAVVHEYGYLLSPRRAVPAAAVIASFAVAPSAFALLLGVALALSGSLCAYATQAPQALISFRTAVEASGWLCIVAVLAGFGSRVASGRWAFAELTAAATAFFTGAGMLYLAYFEWSDPPVAVASPVAAKSAAPLGTPIKTSLTLVSTLAPAPPVVHAPAREAPRLTRERSAKIVAATGGRVPVRSACAGLGAVESLQCLRCANESVLAGVFCREQVRLEYCEGRIEPDPACPSPIPVSLPY
jgi:hypothetical protein